MCICICICICTISGFHTVFLVTPPSASGLEPPWTRLEEVISAAYSDYPDIKPAAEKIGVKLSELNRYRTEVPTHRCKKPQSRFYRRVYAAVILYSLVQERPLQRVANSLNVKRGVLQMLQKDGNLDVYVFYTSIFKCL